MRSDSEIYERLLARAYRFYCDRGYSRSVALKRARQKVDAEFADTRDQRHSQSRSAFDDLDDLSNTINDIYDERESMLGHERLSRHRRNPGHHAYSKWSPRYDDRHATATERTQRKHSTTSFFEFSESPERYERTDSDDPGSNTHRSRRESDAGRYQTRTARPSNDYRKEYDSGPRHGSDANSYQPRTARTFDDHNTAYETRTASPRGFGSQSHSSSNTFSFKTRTARPYFDSPKHHSSSREKHGSKHDREGVPHSFFDSFMFNTRPRHRHTYDSSEWEQDNGTRSSRHDFNAGKRRAHTERPSADYHQRDPYWGPDIDMGDYEEAPSRGYRPAKDLYVVLGVERSVTPEELKGVHRKLSLQCHPDRAQESDKAKATKRMAEINEAYDVLKDEETKALYDRTGKIYGY